MNHNVNQAKRLIEAFVALIVGRTAQVHWDGVGSIDSTGGIHLPVPQAGDAAEIALLTRLAVHEGGHLLETQEGFADRLTPEELIVFNVLEDPRMEGKQLQRFPGAAVVLSRGLDGMLQNIEENLEHSVAADPQRALQLDMLMRGFLAAAPYGPFARRAPQILGRLAPHVSDKARAAIDEVVAKLPGLQTSLEAEEAARAFIARLREPEPPLPEPAKGEGEQADEEGEPAEQPEQGSQSNGGEQGEQAEKEGSEQSPAEKTPSEAPSEAGGTGDPDSDAEAAGENGSNDDEPAGDGQQNAEPGEDAPSTSPQEEAGSEPSREPASNSPSGAEAGDGAGGADVGSQAGQPNDLLQPTDGTSSSADAGADAASTSDSLNGPDERVSAERQPTGLGGDPLDLGALLREAHVARYGEAQHGAAAAEPGPDLGPSDTELARLAGLLEQADPDGNLEELVAASLAALSEGEQSADSEGEPCDGAGMSLAHAPSPPVGLIETRLQGVQSRLVTVLQRELQDKRRRPTRAAYAGGRVIPQRFWRLGALGDAKVFAARQHVSGIDATATVLLDSSSSMEKRLGVAASVTMAFSLALQRLGVRTRVVRFPGTETVTETIQRFGESARSCVQRCEELTASGGTPIGASIAHETPALLQQRKLKNVLAVITDDEPGDKDTLLAALARAEELGVLVVGVGIGCDIRCWIPHSVSVQHVNELPDALARLFREDIKEKLAA